MYTQLTYEVQKAVIEERLRKAALAQQYQLAQDRSPRLATAARSSWPRRWRVVVGLLAVMRSVPSREPSVRR